MNARARQQQAEADAWLKANEKWADGLENPDSLATPQYVGPAAEDGRESVDRRKAVPTGSGVSEVEYVPFWAIAPAPLPDPANFEDERENRAIKDTAQARRDAASDALISKFRGCARHREVLEMLLWGNSVAEIAAGTGYTERHVRNITRGNAQRPEAESLAAWVIRINRAPPVLVFVTVQPVHTLKKRLQKSAALGQLAWDFDAMGVAA